MNEAQKHEKTHAIREATKAKSDLIDVLRRLEKIPGASGAAKELDAIVGRLESWQAKHV